MVIRPVESERAAKSTPLLKVTPLYNVPWLSPPTSSALLSRHQATIPVGAGTQAGGGLTVSTALLLVVCRPHCWRPARKPPID